MPTKPDINYSALVNPKAVARFRADLLRWYRLNARRLPWRETNDPYAIWISEVMLQQTQVRTVLPYYAKFMHAFPDPASLANADLEQVLKLWEGLGYYARARNLYRASRVLVADHQGALPSNRDQLRKLPGVGEYIAAAVLSIAFNQPYPVVDGNVKRILARFFEIDAPVNQPATLKDLNRLAAHLLDPARPGDYNQALMELGALICAPRHPACGSCPVRSACLARRHRSVEAYPRKIKNRPSPSVHMVIAVVLKNDHALITRRAAEGLLGGLWEFPGGAVENGEPPAKACLRVVKQAVNLTVTVDSFLTRVTHAYTHFKLRADVFICSLKAGSIRLEEAVDYRWIRLDQIDQYPFPKANHKFFNALRVAFAERRGPRPSSNR
jgi:A/G-specific adenine glycosylase